MTGSVSGKFYVGGTAEEILGGSIENCYSEATVAGIDHVGGVAGYIDNKGSVGSCYNIRPVFLSDSYKYYIGGVIGLVNNNGFYENEKAVYVSNCYYNKDYGKYYPYPTHAIARGICGGNSN